MALTEGVDVSAFALVVPMIKINTGDFPYDATANIARGFTMLGLGAQYAPGQADWPGSRLSLVWQRVVMLMPTWRNRKARCLQSSHYCALVEQP